MKNNKTVYGEYDKSGYCIFLSDNGDIDEVYRAGNSPFDSYNVVSSGLALRKIREYCIRTGKEIAEENDGKWIGAEHNFDLTYTE
jgi:hypothetical protein